MVLGNRVSNGVRAEGSIYSNVDPNERSRHRLTIALSRPAWKGQTEGFVWDKVWVQDLVCPAYDSFSMSEDKETSHQGELAPRRSFAFGTLASRFVVAYAILYLLPFPLSTLQLVSAIPWMETSFLATGIQWFIGLHVQLTTPLLQALAEFLLGQEISIEFNGSSDTVASYLDVLLDATLALLVALLWWAWRRETAVSVEVLEVSRVLLRYYLFMEMAVYGLIKLIPGG